jgi:hypothetical protein
MSTDMKSPRGGNQVQRGERLKKLAKLIALARLQRLSLLD